MTSLPSTMPANGAPPVAIAITAQHDQVSRLEAWLADEVGQLVGALQQFSGATQAIRKELPSDAHYGQLITLFLGTASLQLAYALLKDGNLPLLLDDGAQHLQKLGLDLDQLFREFEVDGRRFLAVALV